MGRVARAAAVFGFSILSVGAPRAEPITVTAVPVPLDASAPERTQLGALDYRAGFVLSADHPRFGGLSGMVITADGGEMIAVTDTGSWLRARLTHDHDGRLTGIESAVLLPMRDPDGVPLRGKRDGDAEALTRDGQGGLLVAFEGTARLWRYAGDDPLRASAQPLPLPPGPAAIKGNDGFESLAPVPGGLLMLTEGAVAGDAVRGWVLNGDAMPVFYPYAGYFQPTAAAALDPATLLIVERGFSLAAGVAVRIMRVETAQLTDGARLAPRELAALRNPVTVDNFEGLAVRRAGGETLLYLLSDDNFNPLQRTLLLQFALVDGG